ncbi:histidine kinase, partial [Providencia rettgeri]
KIFAQDAKTGEVETFPDILRGWGITLDRTAGKPPLEWFNAVGKRVDEWLMYLTQRGVAEWDTTLSYPKTAIIQFNSVVYVSIKENKGEQPDKSQAAWSTLGVYLGLGNYQLKGDYATNTALMNGLNTKLNITNVAQTTGTSTTSVMSQKAVTEALQNAVNLDTIYPVGIVTWFAQNKDPNTLFPNTKWQYIGENKTIRLANSSGNNVLSSGGSDSVTIGKGHLPAVSLKYSGTTSSNGGHTHNRGTMNITGALNSIHDGRTKGASGAFSWGGAGGSWSYGNAYNQDANSGWKFDASKSWAGETSNNGVHTHTFSGNTENLGSGTALTVTNAYIMLMGWYRLS